MMREDEGPGDAGVRQIGEVADAVGLSLRTIRHCEEVGLVSPSGRSAGGFQLYTDDDVEYLRLVKHMKPLDCTLEEMRQVLSLCSRSKTDGDGGEDTGRVRRGLEDYAALAAQRCAGLRDQLAVARVLTGQLASEAKVARGGVRR